MKTHTREDIAKMSAGKINRALDLLDAAISKNNDALIEAGFGHLTFSETAKLNHEAARECVRLADQRFLFRMEVERRYGPGAPSRLPSRGFGPIKAI